jgi:hypothetical protein
MRTRLRALLAVIAAAPLAAQSSDLPPGVLRLSRIKGHVRRQIAQLPEFTCLQSVQRYSGKRGEIMKPLDTARVEALFTNQRERYAAAGTTFFSDQDPSSFISGATIETGVFVRWLPGLFIGEQALFQYRGDEDDVGRRLSRYDFRLPALMSGYSVEMDGVRATVGIRGSVWVDPASLDPARVVAGAEEIPPGLPVLSAEWSTHYVRVPIGGGTVLLAQTSELHMIKTTGQEFRDLTEFTHCRSFHAETSVSFHPDALAASVLPPAAEQTLPPGLLLSARLATPVTETSTAGSPMEASLSAAAVRAKSTAAIPEGAVVRGLVRGIERYSDAGDAYLVAIEFDEIVAGDAHQRFFADLQSVEGAPGIEAAAARRIQTPDLPGVAVFLVRGTRPELPRGLKMTWKTRALR